jgi:hypothetical protein
MYSQTPRPQPQGGNTIIVRQPPSAPPSQPQVDIDGPTGVDDMIKSLTRGTTQEDLTEHQLSDVDTTGTMSDLGSEVKTINFQNKRTTRSNHPSKKRVKFPTQH